MYLPYKMKNLGVSVDLPRLQREIEAIHSNWWVRHRFDGSGHDVVLLITRYGTLANPDGSPNHALLPPFAPTEYLRNLPYVSQVLHSFGVSPSRSRLMRVGAGETVMPHQDRHPHWNNKVRVHIPVFTDPRVMFHVWSESPALREADHEAVHMSSGHAWVFNSWYFHAVTNDSLSSRIHLTADFDVTGPMHQLLFDGCTEQEIEDWNSFIYPPYTPDPDVAQWANGGSHVS